MPPAVPRSEPLSRRLTRINVLAMASALVVAGLAFTTYNLRGMAGEVTRSVSVEAELIAANSTSALTFDDAGAAARTLATLAARPDIRSAAIYRPDGRRFAAYTAAPGITAPPRLAIPAGREQATHFTLSTLQISRPIRVDNDVIGSVDVTTSLAALYTRLAGFAAIALATLLLSLGAGWLVLRVSQREISEPLIALAALTEHVREQQDYNVRATVEGRARELHVLVESVNAMLDAIQRRDGELLAATEELEARVLQRTAELRAANEELESFSYSVSHDLRAPLRHVLGFATMLERHAAASLDDRGRHYLKTIADAATQMGRLIDDLLALSRLGRASLKVRPVDLGELVAAARADVETSGRRITWTIQPLPQVVADPDLLRPVLVNLLSNAVKYTSTRAEAAIEIGASTGDGEIIVSVKDNGVGFDMAYAHKLFGVFQRLHRAEEFPGTGIGLANVRRIVQRHGGRVWAESAVDAGATFHFSLPAVPDQATGGTSHAS
jgi:signal transduction histidine kinase